LLVANGKLRETLETTAAKARQLASAHSPYWECEDCLGELGEEPRGHFTTDESCLTMLSATTKTKRK
jgi:hypothetical protein